LIELTLSSSPPAFFILCRINLSLTVPGNSRRINTS